METSAQQEQLHTGPSALGGDVEAEELEIERDDRKEAQLVKINELRTALKDDALKAGSQLVNGGELDDANELLLEAYLRRWLRSRRWDVGLTAKCIKAHAEWRATMFPNGRYTSSDVPNEIASGKVFHLGCDRQGRSVLLIQARKHNAWTRVLEELQRFCCYILDLAVSKCDLKVNPLGRIAVILDLTDMGMTSMDIPAVTALFKLLGEHYVERLGVMVMYNPPLIFWGAWNTLSPLLPAVTRRKILVVAPSDSKAMVESLGEEVLPPEYGGKAQVTSPVT